MRTPNMVREELMQKARSFHLRRIFDRRHDNGPAINGKEAGDEKILPARIDVAAAVQQLLPDSPTADDGELDSPTDGGCKRERLLADMELMKERFSKLLLGEDMSGGGKGVSSALALSNAITNLAASVFGEQKRLEPMNAERKARWRKEIDWLLSVTDYVVEFVPVQQKTRSGLNMEIMTTQQRRDLRMNITALRKLDRMLLDVLDNFKGEQEFKYVSRDADKSEEGVQMNDKWWLPNVKVPPSGLSEESRQFLLQQKEDVNQVLKSSMAINAQILSDMDIPENYIESLPKNGRESLGELIYKSITDESFDSTEFLSSVDLSSEHKVVDLKNRIEASVVIWRRKMHQKDSKSSWASAISIERRELFEERAETILLLLKYKFPGISQSSLEISKIQYSRDVGLAVMESYSRVLESLASTVMSRIQDVLRADTLAGDPSIFCQHLEDAPSPTLSGIPNPSGSERHSPVAGTRFAKKLQEFIGWDTEQPPESTIAKKNDYAAKVDNDEDILSKPASINTNKKFSSYLDKIEMNHLRSPTARH